VIQLAALVLLPGLAQLPSTKPEEAVKLAQGDLARVYKQGGLTTQGPFRSLFILRENGDVKLAWTRSTRSGKLTNKESSDLTRALAGIDIRTLTAKRRTETYPPSAMDLLDIYVAFRKDGKTHNWDNVRYEFPQNEALFDVLNAIEKRISGR
jgi:hypothetical protein